MVRLMFCCVFGLFAFVCFALLSGWYLIVLRLYCCGGCLVMLSCGLGA